MLDVRREANIVPSMAPERETNTTCLTSDNKNDLQPFSRFFHPEKSVIDIIVSFLFAYILPLSSMVAYTPESTPDGCKQSLDKCRATVIKLLLQQDQAECKKWSKACSEGLITCVFRVELQKNLLSDWGIDDSDNNEREDSKMRSDAVCGKVDVLLRCPKTVLSSVPSPYHEDDAIKRKNDENSTISTTDLQCIGSDVPIIVWFHGGGMVTGTPRDGYSVAFINRLLAAQQAKKEDVLSIFDSYPVVLASVDYSLAPESPFPAAIIDCLAAVSSILEATTSRNIHIAGQSAGGNLASVVACECHRRYPGRIKSVFLQDPMLKPEADTASYFMNSTSSGLCPVDWLRWCWRVYLSLDNNDHTAFGTDRQPSPGMYAEEKKVKTVDEKLRSGSNRGALCRSNRRQSGKLWRLCSPVTDLPPNLNREEAPRFIVVTSTACPLHDDGTELVNALEQRDANVSHVESRGSHVFGLDCDAVARDNAIEAWRSVIFDT